MCVRVCVSQLESCETLMSNLFVQVIRRPVVLLNAVAY